MVRKKWCMALLVHIFQPHFHMRPKYKYKLIGGSSTIAPGFTAVTPRNQGLDSLNIAWRQQPNGLPRRPIRFPRCSCTSSCTAPWTCHESRRLSSGSGLFYRITKDDTGMSPILMLHRCRVFRVWGSWSNVCQFLFSGITLRI